MRTVKRESVKLNKAKFEALERISRATASDKQAHLDFYQQDLNFPAAYSYRLRRNELKRTNHHASTPLSVHASDLAVKEILLKDYQSRLEHPNASKEKLRRMTVPGQTLERDEAPKTKSSRQSKSETAAGKKTKSAVMK